MRCEFADQHVIRAIEDDRFAQPGFAAAIETCDRKLAEAAAGCATAGADQLTGLIEAIECAFDERSAAIATRLRG